MGWKTIRKNGTNIDKRNLKHMNVLIDIGHPAHVHLFRNFANELVRKGHSVLFSVRKKESNIELLQNYGFKYFQYGYSDTNVLLKILSVIKKNIALAKIFRHFQPNITISHGSFYLSQVSWYYNIPNITLEDTGNLEQVWLYLPFTRVVLTPKSYHRNHGRKQITYSGFHELAYLHPKRFNPANVKLLKGSEVASKPVILIRLVSWSASHDLGHRGLNKNLLKLIVESFDKRAFIMISSEKELDDEFLKYKLNIQPHKIHEILANLTLYIGEGATMASECAVLGVPAIYINTLQAGTINGFEQANLLFHLIDETSVLKKIEEILITENSQIIYKSLANKFLYDKIDLTGFLVWFVENYPESVSTMKANPESQTQFK